MFGKNFLIFLIFQAISILLFIIAINRDWTLKYVAISKNFFCGNSSELICGNSSAEQSIRNDEDNSEILLKLISHIIRAHRYSRSAKTIYELNESFNIVQLLLEKSRNLTLNQTLDNKISPNRVVVENENAEPEICPEIYKGMKYGYPYYFTGYVTDHSNCVGKPLGTIITVLVNLINDITVDDLRLLLNGFNKYYPNITVMVAHSSKQNLKTFSKYKNFRPFAFSGKLTGSIWLNLAQNATTKYVFIARHLIRIDKHTSFERLLRFLSYETADVVGTSHRYADGRWFRGCHSAALRNYTLKFVDGYDFSYNSCIYCDYLTGPFAIRREMFINVVDEKLDGDFVFVDMFTKMAQDYKRILSCPDVSVAIHERELHDLHKSDWFSFVQKWKLNRIVFTNGQDLWFTCIESKVSCSWQGGIIMPICCIRELADMMKFTFEILSENDIVIELEAGSNVGASKMYGITPTERDADFDYRVADQKKFMSLASQFNENGYELYEREDGSECIGNMSLVNCGSIAIRNAHWRMEMWGTNYLGSDETIHVGFVNRTRVMIDGMWMTSLHSPALAARNEYGDDIYQHVEHWITLGYGNLGWVQPKSGHWLKCPKPGFHGCLDLYLPVGDIQFKDVWI